MNASLFLTLTLSFLFLLLLAEEEKRETYVVYMGAVPDDASAHSLKQSHLQLLSSVLKRDQQVEEMIVRRYEHGFSGFAAKLLQEEAAAMGVKEGVVSVFRDPVLQLHTTRSWDFLQETSEETDTNHDELPAGGSDTIVGVLDTGIWPESKSFDDSGMGEVPGRWKGVCMTGTDFSTSNCNKKLIGARYYSSVFPATGNGSPRDDQGHGSHTSSTAAGNAVSGASYYGVALGMAKGGSTGSRIAMYKVCGWRGCPGSALLSGFDDAVADGVDLLSVSIGSSAYARPDYSTDPIAIGAFHAVANGITVVCSAGNDGPYSGTVVNAAPWIFTVAATTIDRKFESDVVLGGSKEAVKDIPNECVWLVTIYVAGTRIPHDLVRVGRHGYDTYFDTYFGLSYCILGESVNFSNLEKSAVYPIIYGGSATSNSSDDASASHCEIGALDADKIKGKIVLCYHSDDRDFSKSSKAELMQMSGAIGAIFVQDAQNSVASTYITFPATEITSQAAANIFTYINSTKNPVATILPTITVDKYKPAPAVASFSSRGPSPQTSNILKPDIAAPGVNILASWIPTNGSSEVPPGQKPSTFHLDSGTSMSCPHVTGVAATIKSWNPTWSPSAIRSAIMTTANLLNNNKAPITTDSGSTATPYDYGAGEVNPNDALQPGLVYEVETEDYLQFLCNYGYQATTIKLITKVPDGFECPKNSSKDLISNLNYPSISVSNFTGTQAKVLNRVVTNVGGNEATTYTVSVKSPPGLDVKVVPDKLQFTANTKKLTYQVSFSSSSTLKSDAFGSITWTDGTHRVRSPFVVSST